MVQIWTLKSGPFVEMWSFQRYMLKTERPRDKRFGLPWVYIYARYKFRKHWCQVGDNLNNMGMAMNGGGKLWYPATPCLAYLRKLLAKIGAMYQLQALLGVCTYVLSPPKYCHGLPVGRETNKSGSLCRKVSMYGMLNLTDFVIHQKEWVGCLIEISVGIRR